jgi:ribosome maturation protein SDO1
VLGRETDLDDVLQISNVFINVSKGEVAKANDLQKAFATSDVSTVVKEVRPMWSMNSRENLCASK